MNKAVYASEITNATPISACALSTVGADGPDRISRTEYDAEGQVLTEWRAWGVTTGGGFPATLQQEYARNTYSPNGQRLSVRDANDNRSAFVYDGFDRPCRLYFPNPTLGANQAATGGIAESALTCASGGTSPDYEGYDYDENDNRVSLRLRSGESIGYTYDALNRELFKDIPGGTSADVTSRYDLAGRRTFARFSTTLTPSADCTAINAGVDYCYDTVGRLEHETSYGRQLDFAYDAASNRTRITHPDANYFQYTYDALNRVDQVQLNGSTSGLSLIANYDYDAQSRRTDLVRGNGGTTEYDYTLASRLSELDHDLDVFGASANDANWDYSYNVAGQVTSRTLVQVYERTVPALNESYNRNGLNQYTSVGGVSFAYAGGDGQRGNLTSDGARTFDYDLENRLLSVVEGGVTTGALEYDPLGRLRSYAAGGTTTEFLYDGDRLIAEYVSGALARRYAHGPGVDEPLIWYEGSGVSSGQNWLIADRQGSIIATTNASGVSTTYAYDPYGVPREWSGPRFRYTGQAILAELRLYHYKARVYDPVIGRFLQTDPIGHADDFNLYTYGANDALNHSDPLGTQAAPDCEEVGASSCRSSTGLRQRPAETQPPRPPATRPDPTTTTRPPPRAPPQPSSKPTVPPVVLLAAVIWLGTATETAPGTLSDSDRNRLNQPQYAIRGGLASPDSLTSGTGPAPYGMTGFSVTTAPGRSPYELAMIANYPNPTVSVTTVQALNALGYEVVPTPLPGQPLHATVNTGGPLSRAAAEQLAGAFGVKFANPNPRPRR
jgi:RHS repeat-associated protein